MLNKIGITKCNKVNLKYFQTYTPFEKINLDSTFKPIDNIVSFMASNKVTELEILDCIVFNNKESNTSIAYISLEVTYKIIYSSRDSNNLHIIDHKSNNIIKVRLPYYIDGLTTKQLLNLKRLKCEIFIEDAEITIQSSRSLFISPYILCEIIILPDYTLALNIEMFNGENNIFISYPDGSRLIQKTFTKNMAYKNLTWCPFNSEIAYLSNENGHFELYTLNSNNRNPIKVKLDFYLGEINGFCYISNDNIVFSCISNGVYDLYNVNTKTLTISRLTHSIDGFSCIYPKYNIKKDKIFFINKNPHYQSLSYIDKNGLDLNFICKKSHIIDFDINNSGEYIVLIYKDIEKNFYKSSLIDFNSLTEKEIICISEKHMVKQVKFCPTKNILAFCIYYMNKDDLFLFDIKSSCGRNLTQNPPGVSISNFSFNFAGDNIYYCSSLRGNYDVYSININDFKIKSLINCFSKNISLAYKGI